MSKEFSRKENIRQMNSFGIPPYGRRNGAVLGGD